MCRVEVDFAECKDVVIDKKIIPCFLLCVNPNFGD